MLSFSIMPACSNDFAFLQKMLYEAAFWRNAIKRPSISMALKDRALSVYLEDFGRPGDYALIAKISDESVGAAWARQFSNARHGYGFVDVHTPELTLAVSASYRRCGIGRSLLTAIIAAQTLFGVRQLSLSVEKDNPARSLYESAGFVCFSEAPSACTLLRQLKRLDS